MLKHRVIPCLLLRDGGLVKTTRFNRPRYVGDPVNAIRIFNEKEVDELMVLDIVASRQNRGPDFLLIEEFAGECFMPLCYGGGISSVEQAQQLFALGVEKICLQASILKDPSLITSIAERFGSQSVVVSVDVKRNLLGQPRLYSAMTRQTLKKPWSRHMCELVTAGAGEVLLNAVNRDGMMNGMDLDLIREASCAVDVPVTAVGGVGSLADIKVAIDAGASAVAAGAFFVFYGPHRAVLITYPRYEELEELLGGCV
jgi:cyclase